MFPVPSVPTENNHLTYKTIKIVKFEFINSIYIVCTKQWEQWEHWEQTSIKCSKINGLDHFLLVGTFYKKWVQNY